MLQWDTVILEVNAVLCMLPDCGCKITRTTMYKFSRIFELIIMAIYKALREAELLVLLETFNRYQKYLSEFKVH